MVIVHNKLKSSCFVSFWVQHISTVGYMKKGISWSLLFFALSVFAISFENNQASASGPFTCRPGFYQVISGHLKILNPLTGVYSDIGVAGDNYNAIGYNPRDNYIYGWGTGGSILGQLVKVDSSGVVTTLGNAGAAQGSYVSGDFDDNNYLYFRKNSTTLIRVNVATSPPTSSELTLSGAAFEGVDMGWIDDVMYSVNNSTLFRVDLNTLQVTTASIAEVGSPSGKEFPTSGSHSYGALFSNRENELYVSNNSLGRIYKITDYGTANPKATWVIDATVTSNNDGAACKEAVSPFSVPTATNDSYSVVSGDTLSVPLANGVFSNDDASSPSLVSHTNPANGTLTLNANGSLTFTPAAGFVGSTTFSYIAQDQWGRNTSSATVTINVTAAAATTTVAPTTTTTPTIVPTTTVTPSVASTGTKDEGEKLPQSGSEVWLIFAATMMIGFGFLITKMRDEVTE
jgi:hypothetical protein